MFVPRWVAVVDAEALPSALVAPVRDGEPSCRFLAVRVLVRLHGAPLGLIECPLVDGVLSGEALRHAIDLELSKARVSHEAACPGRSGCPSWGPEPTELPFVSVVVSTRERPELLAQCLQSLCALEYPEYEVVVADNAPLTQRTRAVVEGLGDDRVRYVCTPVPGPSAAKNLGVAHSTGDIVAFTDDDVTVDPNWLLGLVRGFGRRADVGLVTGLVLAAELESESQALFEREVSWGVSLDPRVAVLDRPPPGDVLFPFNAGSLGAGASFAMRRDIARRVGDFDEALGPGTPTQSGEDIDYFLRMLVAGYVIAYEPASLAWHRHRRDMASLKSQLTGYGTGLGAYGFKHALNPQTRRAMLRRLPAVVGRLSSHGRSGHGWTSDRFPEVGPLPRKLRRGQILSMIRGPSAYLRARAAMNRRSHDPVVIGDGSPLDQPGGGEKSATTSRRQPNA